MYRLVRKVHLWVGLILAVVLLVEAVSGLILAEPGWFGAVKQKPPGIQASTQGTQGQAAPERAKSAPGVYGLAKGLHEGRVGGLDLRWVIDVSAVGLVVLTVTGVCLAVPALRARGRRR
ncbi:PepSY-associated TM helix domain-containing protein [Anaeroselena agilis]|uniref:PepSY-associated TM helix domain-containing protein n=1 Tax=Anaeroselena agilis TaxID=3063788 RepID=UPI0039B6EA4C